MDGDVAYIGKEVSQPLINAIADVCDQRPCDPISYIANSLYEYRQHNTLDHESDSAPSKEQENIDSDVQEVETNLSGDIEVTECITSLPIASNKFDSTVVKLPENKALSDPALATCVKGFNKSKWPIRCLAPLRPHFNVNAHYGGGAALVQISNSYGSDGKDTTAEVFLLRCGFDGNHFAVQSLIQSHHGHFGPANSMKTDEYGKLFVECMFGSNHITLLSNIAEYGTLSHGLMVQTDYTGSAVLPVNANGSVDAVHNQSGGGCTLVLCTSTEGQEEPVTALYMIRSGHKDNNLQSSFVCGDDKWKFEVTETGTMSVTGLGQSVLAVYHNRENVMQPETGSNETVYSGHVQCTDGSQETQIFKSVKPCDGAFLVICSSSAGDEDATVAALYMVSLSKTCIKSKFVTGITGHLYGNDCADVWSFKNTGTQVLVTGPAQPCRYSWLSTFSLHIAENIHVMPGCLATGESEPISGSVSITKDAVTGWVSTRCDLIVKDNEKGLFMFKAEDLQLSEGKCVFYAEYPVKLEGLHNIRVFALKRRTSDNIVNEIELGGSPFQVCAQPQGVVCSVNVSGQKYEATTGEIYESEFTPFLNVDPNYGFGTRCKAYGGYKNYSKVPQIFCHTEDGEIYSMYRSPFVEAQDEKKVNYIIDDIEDGEYILRVHFFGTSAPNILECNGTNVANQVEAAMFKTIYPYAAHKVDVTVQITDSRLDLRTGEITGFALLKKDFKDKVKDKETLNAEAEQRNKLINESEPLARTITRKERQIVGWSSNLVQNPSAQKELANWNVGGNWKSMEGGHGTEKAFVTSFMDCTKYQEIRLLDYFSVEYLDTAPEIQVSEWYREGVCGGGYYRLQVELLDADGKKLDSFDTGETGRIYRQNKWEQVSHNFSNYGSGVRMVTFQSHGRDDKYWAGHFGPIISDAIVRIKRESKAADDDTFTDINTHTNEAAMKMQTAEREKLVTKVLTDNQDLVEVLSEIETVPDVDKTFQKQTRFQRRFTFSDHKKKLKKQEIRVFVSSTFRDFKEEREELIKKTFRELNAICADRGVFFTYVDLRWGITEEQTKTGETIAICLEEIERCRPYFVCMMGDRYGWSQRQDKEDKALNKSFDFAISNYPSKYQWLEKHRYENSVTKLEILHGVLNNVEQNKERSFFYIRDSVKGKDLDAAELKMKSAESEWHEEQQLSLRKQVKSFENVLSVRDYQDVQDMCSLLKKDLQRCIDIDFPVGTELTPLQRELLAHTAFSDAREKVYIGREEYFKQIDNFMAEGKSQPFVVLGESGSGKSALIANWSSRLARREEQCFIFVHFIGSSAESSSSIKLLRRLYEEMKEYFGFHMAIPTSDSNLARDLPTWLTLAGAQEKCYIIFDALNQLDDGAGPEVGNEQDLLWIPKELPPNVQMLLSTLPGRAFTAVQTAGWPHMEVKPLNPSEKFEIVTGYLEGIYGKTLSDEQKDLIVNTDRTNNPLYLKALLDEVRMYGNFRQLTSKIQEYLTAGTPGELFGKILERLEVDFEQDHHERTNLVRDTTAALWCSHRGMAESELLDLLQIPSAIWSPFYLSLRENLVNRNGLLNFFHDHLRQAIQNRYLPTEEERQKQYTKLAEFFEKRYTDQRKVDELPFLLAKCGNLEKLKETISDLEVFKRLVSNEEGKFDLIRSWRKLGDFNQVVDSYGASLDKISESDRETDEYLTLQKSLADFYLDLGLFAASKSMFDKVLLRLEKKYKKSHGTIVCGPTDQTRKYRCNHPAVLELLHMLGEVCEKQKDFNEAKEYFSEAIRRQNKVVTPSQKLLLAKGLLGQATVHYLQKDSSEAKKYLVRAREIATDVLGARHHYVAAVINKIGQLCYKQGRLDEALGYFVQDLKLTRGEVGSNHPRTAVILNDLALMYDDKNDHIAGKLYEATLQVLLNTYGKQHLDVAIIRYNLGCFYFATSYFSRAKYQFTETVKIYTLFLGTDHPDTEEANAALADVSAFC